MIQHCVGLALVFTLAACATAGGAGEVPSGDTRSWIAYHVEVGVQIVQFTIPPGVNEDFLDPPVPERIDLQQPGLFDRTGLGPRLLSRHWDYRVSPFASVDGTLRAYIALWHSDAALVDDDALRKAIEESKRLLRMKDLMEGGKGGPPDAMRFEPAAIGGRRGLLVHHQTSPSHYVVTLDAHHYLTISVDVGGVTGRGWRKDARAAVNAILQSIRVEPK
jgi:hypothetical protein